MSVQAIHHLPFFYSYAKITSQYIQPGAFQQLLILVTTTSVYSIYPVQKNKSYSSTPSGIIKDSLKYENDLAKQVDKIILQAKQCLTIVGHPQHNVIPIINFIRDAQQYWEIALYLAFLQEIQQNKQDEQNTIALQQKYQTVIDIINEKQLSNCFTFKCILDGNQIVSLLGIKKGPAVKPVMDSILIYQIMNQHLSHQQIIDYVTQNYHSLPK